ncbi:hypothetical protein G6F60_014925 [Rhizopus arrhizus]|nr:hypothetical protein G6F60_014925 [Rhizopus arrhizus]
MRGSRLSSAGDRPSRRRRPRRHGPGVLIPTHESASRAPAGRDCSRVRWPGLPAGWNGHRGAWPKPPLGAATGQRWRGRHAARRRHLTRCTHERNKAAVARARHPACASMPEAGTAYLRTDVHSPG